MRHLNAQILAFGHFRIPSIKTVVRTSILASCVALTGCGSILSGAGPFSGTISRAQDDHDAPYKLIEITAATLAPFAVPPEAEVSSAVSDNTMPEVRLLPGDSFRVMISDSVSTGAIFAPLSSGGTIFDKVRIDYQGNVVLPYVGKLHVGDLTTSGVEEALRKRLERYATDPQVFVQQVEDVSGSVVVAGAVKNPGRFSAMNGPLTLLDVINLAGGPTLEPHLINIVVRAPNRAPTVSTYVDVLGGKNIVLSPRSEVIVSRAPKRFVAMGAVKTPGLHDLPTAVPSLLDALGVLGGLNEATADPTGVFIFRLNRNPETNLNEPLVFRLNMREPQSIFVARQFLVQPDDAIYVTNAPIYEWQKIITPIVQVLILGQRL